MNRMTATIHGSTELGTLIAELIRNGVNFEVTPVPNDVNVVSYLVTFNGGI